MYKQNITTIAELVNTIARLRLSVTLIGFVLHQNANICLVFMFWPQSLHLLQVHTLAFQHACNVALLRDQKKKLTFLCVFKWSFHSFCFGFGWIPLLGIP